MRDNGFYLIKFVLDRDCENVLEGGPYFLNGGVMIIKNWDKDLKLDRDILTSIPLCI